VKTPLYDRHLALGARMTEFSGWQMPVQYDGILAEHEHTRTAASLFDTCHMGEFRVTGPGAAEALQRALACRVRKMHPGTGRYGFLLAEDGGVLDDLFCYRLAEEEWMVVGNAGTLRRDAATIAERVAGEARFEDVTDRTAKLDVQGPAAADALAPLTEPDIRALAFRRLGPARVAGIEVLLSRTGYTGELGYELYLPVERAGGLWDALLERPEIRPAGLGARDTLRLEMGFPLYGHELDETVSPVEAGLDWALPSKAAYLGAEAVARRKAAGPDRTLVGIRLEGRRAAREGDTVFAGERSVGRVTSGSFAPSIGAAVALAWVEPAAAEPDTPLEAESRGTRLPGRVTPLPFWRRGTIRTSLATEKEIP
jgi:aminomethyltransferase